jgi:hypothetical protein
MQGDSKSLGVTKSINNSIAKKMKKVEGRAALGPKTAARRFRLDTGKQWTLTPFKSLLPLHAQAV